MDKDRVAEILIEIGILLDLKGENPFKSRAYVNASRALEEMSEPLDKVIAEERLDQVNGIGESIQKKICEIVTTGKLAYYEELKAATPPGLVAMLEIPGLGPKKIKALHDELGIETVEQLEQACKDGRVADLKGFGEKTQQKILEGVGYARKRESHFLLPVGLEVGEQIRERLADIDAVENAEVSGSVRRRLEVIRNVNIAVATRDFAGVKKALRNIVANIEELDANTVKGVARNEMDVYFHLAKPQEFGSTLFRTT